MKREISVMLLLVVLGLANIGFNIFTNWDLKEDDYSVKITATEILGTFPSLKATLNFDPADPEQDTSSASIDACRLCADFFLQARYAFPTEANSIGKYPKISFQSDAITKKYDLYEATGKMIVKDVNKNIIISFTFNGPNLYRDFKGNLKIRPKEYHLTCSGMPEIPVAIDILEPRLNSHTFSNDLAELATMNEFLDDTDLGWDFKRRYQGSIQIKRFTDSKIDINYKK